MISFRFSFLSLLLFHALLPTLPLLLPPAAHFLLSLVNSLSNEDENSLWQAKWFCVSQVLQKWNRKELRGVRFFFGLIMAALHLLRPFWPPTGLFRALEKATWPITQSIFCLWLFLSQPETNLIPQLSLLMPAAWCYWSGSPLRPCLPLAVCHLYLYLFPLLQRLVLLVHLHQFHVSGWMIDERGVGQWCPMYCSAYITAPCRVYWPWMWPCRHVNMCLRALRGCLYTHYCNMWKLYDLL